MDTPQLKKNCLYCGKEFYKRVNTSISAWFGNDRRKDGVKFCSKDCSKKSFIGKPAWNKGLKRNWEATGSFKKGHKIWNKGLLGYKSGSESGMWKGEKASKIAQHAWIRRRIGHAKKCKFCGFKSENHHAVHWANISGNYLRDVNDYIPLCAKCHRNYDLDRNKNKL